MLLSLLIILIVTLSKVIPFNNKCCSHNNLNSLINLLKYFSLIKYSCSINVNREYSEYIYQGINSEYLNLSFADNQSNGQSGSKKNLLFGSKSESGSKSKSESGFMPSKYLDTSCAVNKNNSQLGSQEKLLFGSE